MADQRWAVNLLAVPAVRYALGRRTYVVADVTDTLAANLDALTPDTRRIIISDIDAAATLGTIGMAMDHERWMTLRSLLKEPN
jgi:hypothetical protein